MHATSLPARRRIVAIAASILAIVPAAGALAQASDPKAMRELAEVRVHRKTNAGDLPYKSFFALQAFVQSLLPRGPRVIDLRLRVNFASDKGPAYDEFQPRTWAVAIVGESVDHIVPVSRGGYFLLPELPDAAEEHATIMFNTPTREGRIALEWKLRVADGQTLSYARFAQAFDEVGKVQRKIPWDRPGMREARMVEYDGLKACFRASGGRIDVGGQAAAARTEGNCQVLKFDPETAKAGAADISFTGPLDIVTLHARGI